MESYLFLSYAHKDWPEIESYYYALEKRGCRIWYDKRIVPGSEWVESIAENLKNAAGCLLFLSPDSLTSINVRREIHYAVANHIPITAVILKPCELSEGLKLELGDCCVIDPAQYRSREECIDILSAILVGTDSDAAGRIKFRKRSRIKTFLGYIGFLSVGAVISALLIGTVLERARPDINVKKADILTGVTAFVEAYYDIVNQGDSDAFQTLWDSWMSETTKGSGAITEEEWMKMNLEEVREHGYHIYEYQVLEAETLSHDTIAYRSRVRFEADGKTYTEENREYLIIENGEYRYLYNGILSLKTYEGGMSSLENVYFKDLEIKEYADGLLISMKLNNRTGSVITLGSEDDPHLVTIDTTAGSYDGAVDQITTIQPGKTKSLEMMFYSATGEPQSIQINHISTEGSESDTLASLELWQQS